MPKTHADSLPQLCAVRSGHLSTLHGLVKSIASYSERPENWPLTQAEQISFFRHITAEALKIKKSEGFLVTELLLAAAITQIPKPNKQTPSKL